MCFQETQRLMQEPVPGIQAIPDEQNARYFHVVVAGPEGVRNPEQLLKLCCLVLTLFLTVAYIGYRS